MKKDEIISMLQQQIGFLQQQLGEANRKVDELLRKVSSLEELLVRKNQEEQKQRNVIRGLTKIQQNKSEKQTPPAVSASDSETAPQTDPKPREKTNYGARRKDHYEVEVEEEDIYPDDSRFDEMRARLIDTHDVVRYILVPMRFIKKVYHVHVYTQDGAVMEGRAPVAPLLGSNYDGSFIAGIAQLRYIYSMPVERIVKYFCKRVFREFLVPCKSTTYASRLLKRHKRETKCTEIVPSLFLGYKGTNFLRNNQKFVGEYNLIAKN